LPCGFDISLLSLVRTPSKKDDELRPILPEVNSIARPVVDAMLEETSTHSLVITEIALPHSSQRDHHPIRAPGRQAVEPISEWRVSLVRLEFPNLCHTIGIVYVTNWRTTSCTEGCRRNELAPLGGGRESAPFAPHDSGSSRGSGLKGELEPA